MTPTDELWIDMAQFDINLADGLWDGDQLPDDAPAWCDDVSSLIRTARGPATADELAGQEAIVSRMAEAILQAAVEGPLGGADAEFDVPIPGAAVVAEATTADDEPVAADPVVGSVLPAPADVADGTPPTVSEAASAPPAGPVGAPPAEGGADLAPVVSLDPVRLDGPSRPRSSSSPAHARRPDDGRPRHLRPSDDEPSGGRLVRRLVAVKAVATTTAVAIGITAAAAATGVVVTVVDPPRWTRPATSVESLSPATAADDDDGESGSTSEGSGPGGAAPGGAQLSPTRELACVINFGCPASAGTTTTVPHLGTTTTTAGTTGTTATTPTTAADGPEAPPPTTGTTATTAPTTTTTADTTPSTTVETTTTTTTTGGGEPTVAPMSVSDSSTP